MEAVLVIGLVVTFLIMLVRTGDQNRRIERLEQELKFAKQGYDGLAARLWQLERAFGDAMQTILSLKRDLADRKVPGAAQPPVASPAEGAPAASTAPIAAPHDASSPIAAAAASSPVAAAPIAPTDWKPVVTAASGPSPAQTDWKPVTTYSSGPLTGYPPSAPANEPQRGGEPPGGGPPAEPPAPESEPIEPPPPSAGIEWERWIGVRGAAALGAAILVIAGLYFFKYSIDKGIITPEMRVVMGTLVGLGCIAGSEQQRRKSHIVLANWLAGAGIAILYTAFWAAKSVYGLIGTEVAFGLMIVVTSACVLLAIRHESIVIAILGLLGGFATPFALSTGSDHPIGLFGYLLLLDVGLLITAQRRKWPALGLLSLGGTLVYEAFWIADRMGPDRIWLGIGVVTLFAGVFAFGARPAASDSDKPFETPASVTAIVGTIAPFAFGLYFGLRSDLGPNLYPIGVLLGVLTAGAVATAILRRNMGGIAIAAAVAGVTVLAAWLLRHEQGASPWEIVIVVCAIAVILHAALEIASLRKGREPREVALAASISSLGSMLLILIAAVAPSSGEPTPWLAAWGLLAALALRQGSFAGREPVQIGVAIALGVALPAFHAAHLDDATFPRADVYFGIVIAAAVILQVAAMLRRSSESRRWGDNAAALLALLLLVEPLAFPRASSPAVILGGSLVLGFLALLAATRRRSGVWTVAMPLVAIVQTSWLLARTDIEWDSSIAKTALLFMAASVLLFTAWPRLASRAFKHDTWAWRAAALAGPVWFPGLRQAWIALYGDRFIGVLPIALGFLAFFAAAAARGVWERESPLRRTALAWTLGVALGFVTVAIPLQLDKEWITVGWALEGAALLALWKRLDHPGLKYVGLAHLAVVTIRLVANPSVLEYHPVSRTIILNWLAYTYWLPVLSLVAAWALLREEEVLRLRPWERSFYPRPGPLGAIGAAAAAIVVLFVWLNLTILDAYSVGRSIEIVFEHQPARDLTLSIAWALYALVLLALGMTRDSAGLRWASLALILATVGKAFLYDLAHLKDLYRVASLVGLALSLILISIAYQRFVFGKPTKGKS